MEDLAWLRMMAERIPVSKSSYMHPDVSRRMIAHRSDMLSCNDIDLVKDYVDQSTDEETFAVLAEISARAQLSADYESIFCHLACKIYPAAGLEIPVQARLATDEKGELSPSHKLLLEKLRINIRKAQRGTVQKNVLQ